MRFPVHEHTGVGLPDSMEMWADDLVICGACLYRWRAVRPLVTSIAELKCPCCCARRTEEDGEINARPVRH